VNWLGILTFLIVLATIPSTIIFVRHLDRLDSSRADQVEEWIRGFLNGTPAEED